MNINFSSNKQSKANELREALSRLLAEQATRHRKDVILGISYSSDIHDE